MKRIIKWIKDLDKMVSFHVVITLMMVDYYPSPEWFFTISDGGIMVFGFGIHVRIEK